MFIWIMYLFLIGAFFCIGGVVAFGLKFLIVDLLIILILGRYTYKSMLVDENENIIK